MLPLIWEMPNLIYICFTKREFHFFYKTSWKRVYFIRDKDTVAFVSFVNCQSEVYLYGPDDLPTGFYWGLLQRPRALAGIHYRTELNLFHQTPSMTHTHGAKASVQCSCWFCWRGRLPMSGGATCIRMCSLVVPTLGQVLEQLLWHGPHSSVHAVCVCFLYSQCSWNCQFTYRSCCMSHRSFCTYCSNMEYSHFFH